MIIHFIINISNDAKIHLILIHPKTMSATFLLLCRQQKFLESEPSHSITLFTFDRPKCKCGHSRFQNTQVRDLGVPLRFLRSDSGSAGGERGLFLLQQGRPLIANTSPQSGHRQEASAVGVIGRQLRPPPARPTAAPAPSLPLGCLPRPTPVLHHSGWHSGVSSSR